MARRAPFLRCPPPARLRLGSERDSNLGSPQATYLGLHPAYGIGVVTARPSGELDGAVPPLLRWLVRPVMAGRAPWSKVLPLNIPQIAHHDMRPTSRP